MATILLLAKFTTRIASISRSMSHRYFEDSDHADIYQQFRPSYPEQLVDFVSSFGRPTNDRRTVAVDVGCGTGQLTHLLADRFEKVIGLDISASQIEQARL